MKPAYQGLALGAAVTAPFALHAGNLTLAIGCVLTSVVLPIVSFLSSPRFGAQGVR